MHSHPAIQLPLDTKRDEDTTHVLDDRLCAPCNSVASSLAVRRHMALPMADTVTPAGYMGQLPTDSVGSGTWSDARLSGDAGQVH